MTAAVRNNEAIQAFIELAERREQRLTGHLGVEWTPDRVDELLDELFDHVDYISVSSGAASITIVPDAANKRWFVQEWNDWAETEYISTHFAFATNKTVDAIMSMKHYMKAWKQ